MATHIIARKAEDLDSIVWKDDLSGFFSLHNHK
jgi:hypothetical protein